MWSCGNAARQFVNFKKGRPTRICHPSGSSELTLLVLSVSEPRSGPWWVPFTLEVSAKNDVMCVDCSQVQKVGIRCILHTQTRKQHVH